MKKEKICTKNRQYNVTNSVITNIFTVQWTTFTSDVSEETISQGKKLTYFWTHLIKYKKFRLKPEPEILIKSAACIALSAALLYFAYGDYDSVQNIH